MKFPRTDRGLPHSWDVERGVLGGLLLDASLLPEVREILGARDFHRPQHVALFEVLCKMADVGQAPDLASVADELERTNATGSVGGGAYVLGLPTACMSVDQVPAYAARVRDYAVRRELLTAHYRGIEAVQAGEPDTVTLLENASRSILAITHTSGPREWEHVRDLVGGRLGEFQRRAEHPGQLTGLSTGFTDLDRKLAGLQPANLIILAGRPAMGKSVGALNIAANVARGGVPVGFFSLEMSRDELTDRLLVAQARVDATKVRLGEIDAEHEWPRLMDAADTVRGLPILIDDTPGLTLTRLRRKARKMQAEHPTLGLIVVDYVQLMAGDGRKDANRTEAVGEISRGLKLIAKELNLPVLAIAQLNRNVESRTNKRPLPSDLRESGSLEADADVILFVYRDEVYNEDSPDKGIAEIIVAKQRGGALGCVKLAFLGQYQLFQNLASAAWAPEPGHNKEDGRGYF